MRLLFVGCVALCCWLCVVCRALSGLRVLCVVVVDVVVGVVSLCCCSCCC